MTNGWHRRDNNSPAAQARKKQYNSKQYKQQRATYKRDVEAGMAHCWRCGQWLPPDQPWHLGHDDHDRTIIHGPECVPCNLTAAASKGARTANQRRNGHTDHRTPASYPIRT